MERSIWIGLGIGVLLVAGGAYYLNQQKQLQQAALPAPLAAPAVSSAPPPDHYPLAEPQAVSSETPLPGLNDSDGPFRDALAKALGLGPVSQFLLPNNLIRRIVATVDALDGPSVPAKVRPLTPIGGAFLVDGSGDGSVISSANAARYRPLVNAVANVDAAAATGVYIRFYPLFQQAYEELGYPGRYFNDRVIHVIDHLRAAPSPDAPVRVVQPEVLYLFADPALEARSGGQKVLARIGTENAEVIKNKLGEIRAAIVSRTARKG
jgi:hypothetical protein